jgi:dihydrofolate reductase
MMNRLPKTVVSDTLSEVGWNARGERAARSGAAKTEKRFPGDIVAVGGMALARGLLASGEIDELRLLLLPQIAVRGRSIFGDDGLDRRFTLVSNQTLDAGAVVLSYQTKTVSS